MKNKRQYISHSHGLDQVRKIDHSTKKMNEYLAMFLTQLKQDKNNNSLKSKREIWQQILELANTLDARHHSRFYKGISNGLLDLFLTEKERIDPLNETQKSNFKVEGINDLEELIAEIKEDKFPGWLDFLTILKEEIELLQETLKAPANDKMVKVYEQLNNMLFRFNSFEIPQRKYVLKIIAKIASNAMTDYQFISSEDFDFVDTRYHQIVEGAGQRIKRGISFIVVDNQTEEVVKYGKVKAG